MNFDGVHQRFTIADDVIARPHTEEQDGMGDVMWGLITRSTKHGQSGTIIKSGRVTGIRFNNNMDLLVTVHRIATGTIGKTIFCSKEAAEQALKEREEND